MRKRSVLGFLIANCLVSFTVGASFYIRGLSFESLILRLMRNHLPDMLWSYSLTFALFLILSEDKKNKTSIVCGVISALWGILMEVLQLLSIAPGTFDIFDLLLEAVSGLAASLIIIFYLRRIRNEEGKIYCCSTLP